MTHRPPATALLLCLAVVLAGCGAITAPEPGSPGTATASENPGLPPDAEVRLATVSTVIDGDTIRVELATGGTETVRLLGVDTPETSGGTSPDEFEGVPNTTAGRACLAEAADEATTALKERLLGKQVRLAIDPTADERDRYGRLLAHVGLAGENVDYWLVAQGHARVYDSEFTFSERFYAAEREAQSEKRGLWRCSDPTTATPAENASLDVTVRHDAPGDDRENPNEEYVVLENRGDETREIGGWRVSDAAGHAFRFPEDAAIPANGSVTVYSGTGNATATEYYWGVGAIWNNDGDTVTVKDETGVVVLERSY